MAHESELPALIDATARRLARPITVGISGYGGSGKSTLTRSLVASVPGSIRMRGDDFLDPVRSHQRSDDWGGVERERLAREVLIPFQSSTASQFRRFDWDRGELAEPEPLSLGDVLIVDLIGLFHPESLPLLDLTIWMDVELDTATERGKARDRRHGHQHDRLWDEIWVPNERDFEERFAPRSSAQILIQAGGPDHG